ncbi:methyl-accepting chemotaxis protein [uncultured Amphritea sp.]|uniref:methyl-accepting chemotaxis protein n=1 Tax=uncultured Amphritea sp. TaxID=981605 RepID=UPI0026269EC5|nr:methyl-accepting chemotaxis protein [uncultured Amphritea sp.]
MFSRLRIRSRILGGFFLLIILVCSIVMPVMFKDMHSLVQTAEKRELTGLYQQVLQKIDAEQRLATTLARFVASLPEVQQHIKNDDRTALQASMNSAFTVLKSEYGLRQFQFHQAPATSYLRVHKPEKYGDDLSGFRQTVVETNSTHTAVSGVEQGVAGLGIRGVVPVVIDGKNWGSVEFGFSLGQPFFDDFKQQTGVDIGLYVIKNGDLSAYGSTYQGALLFDQTALSQALFGEPQAGNFTLKGEDVAAFANQMNDFSGQAIGVIEIAMERSSYLAMINDSLIDTIAIGVVILLLGALVAVLITRSIARPLNEMHVAMDNIASGDGDLTRRLTVEGNNELSDIAGAFNDFVIKIETLVKTLMTSVSNVSNSGSELFDETEKTMRVAKNQQARTEEVATAVNEMTATAHDVAGNAENASSLTQSSQERSEHGYKTVTQSIATINLLAANVAETVKLVSQVDNQSTKIHTILDVIQGIAGQTNLLALNAAIEAARAGDQGRGFAVVADEVRSLAARTQNSAAEINEMITQLQTGTTHTVTVIEESQQQAKDTVSIATESGEALQSIRDAMALINDSVMLIASAAEEQSQVAESINQSVVDIADGATDVATGANHIMTTSSQIGSELNALMAVIRRFKVHKDPAIELAVARSAHQAWKMRLRSFLDGSGALTAAQAVSHKECDFGRWYYGEGAHVCGEYPVLKQLEGPHERMHKLIGMIVEAKHAGKKQQAEDLYHEVCQLSETIVKGMEAAIAQFK